MAAMCADDYMRTIMFLRGLHDAVVERLKRISGRPLRVLYAGCGPYATLAVPLMTLFPAEDVSVSLLDMNPVSIDSARSLVETLGLDAHVSGFLTGDAATYIIPLQDRPDVVVAEVMQNCLRNEPQVAVARNLLRQTPDALMVPEEIGIELELADMAPGFEATPGNNGTERARRERIPLGRVFTLDREHIAEWEGICDTELPAGTLSLPHIDACYKPMLFTTIRTFGDHMLRDYDSGLTIPVPLESVAIAEPGDTIRFRYLLGAEPHLGGDRVGQNETAA